MAYLEGRLPEADRRAVEAMLSEEGMESDALEGLQTLGADEARGIKTQLNAALQQSLKKGRRPRRGMADSRWTLYAVIILMLLAAVAFGVIWLMKHPAP